MKRYRTPATCPPLTSKPTGSPADGDDAIERFAASMTRLPQLNRVGTMFAHNNAALVVAGRLIEVVTETTYEEAVRSPVIDPLKLGHRFLTEEIIGFNVAASHDLIKDKAVVEPAFWARGTTPYYEATASSRSISSR